MKILVENVFLGLALEVWDIVLDDANHLKSLSKLKNLHAYSFAMF